MARNPKAFGVTRSIDQIYNAIRPRLGDLTGSSGITGGPTVVIPPFRITVAGADGSPAGLVGRIEVKEGLPVPATDDSGFTLLINGTTALLGIAPIFLLLNGERPMEGNLDMDEFDVENIGVLQSVDALEFEQDAAYTPITASIRWTDQAGLKRMLLYTDKGDINVGSVYVRVINLSGSQIDAARPVRNSGASGNVFGLLEADADGDELDQDAILGLTVADIPNGDEGWVCAHGHIPNLDTTAYLDGDRLYLQQGGGLGTAPPSPSACSRKTVMAWVTKSDVSTGSLWVEMTRESNLDDLGDVVGTAVAGDVLVRDEANGCCPRWLATGLWTEVELDFGLTDRFEKVFTIADDRAATGQLITMVASAVAPTGSQEDEAEFDTFTCACVVTDPDEFRAYVHSLRGPVVGKYRFNYTFSSPAAWQAVPCA